METPNEFCYLSAATSPRSICSLEDSLNFYSAQTSPTSAASNILFGFISEPTTPIRLVGHHDFEFETRPDEEAQKVVVGHLRGRSGGDYQPMTMAFADELFCDGKVVPLDPHAPSKLKLPPGFRGTVVEPRSPCSVLGRSTTRRCLWNDDFDPFMVALENVREGKNGRRARSLSPNRARSDEYHMCSVNCVDPNLPGKPNVSVSARWTSPRNMWGEDEKSPTRGKRVGLAEPKGVVFARRVKMGQERLEEPKTLRDRRPKSAKGETGARGSRGSYTKEKKREKMMRVLFRVSSSATESCGDEEKSKQEHKSGGESWIPTFLRRLGFRPMGQTQYKKDKRLVSQFAKATFIQCRPRLSLCIGNGGK